MWVTIGDYEYNQADHLGSGSFAQVFKGRYRNDHSKLVAIKLVFRSALRRSRSLVDKEIKILKELTKLNHPNVVKLLDVYDQDDQRFSLIMEYCNGRDLLEYIHKKGTLSEETIQAFVAQLADAVKAIHLKGIIHRDLKPQNILLSYDKPDPHPSEIIYKVADFGFARFLNDGHMAATLCGSPMYMAPEVIMSLQYDAKADLWSIGTIIFQCLTGNAPFTANSPHLLKQIYVEDKNLIPPIPPGTSDDLKDLLINLLKRNPADRLTFQEFFDHKFIRQPQKSCSESSTSYAPSSSSTITKSPAVRVKTPIGSPSHAPRLPSRSATPVDNLSKTKIENVQSGLSSSPEDDFVMVPSSIGLENSFENAVDQHVKKSSIKIKEIEAISSVTRPNVLQIVGPIPVPSQQNAYDLMIKKSREATLKSSSPQLIKESTSPPRSDPINIQSQSRRSTIDIASLSPPSVQYVIGTPPSAGSRRKSLSNSLSDSPSIWQCSPTAESPLTWSGPLAKVPNLSSSNLLDNNNIQNPPTLPFGTRARTLPEISEISNLFSDSCSLRDNPVTFLPPQLPEETLLDSKHNEILAKINFILSVSCCVLDLAKLRSTPLPVINDDVAVKTQPETDSARKSEQFVLLYRALEFLQCGLSLAQQHLQGGDLQRSNTVIQVVQSMYTRYCTALKDIKQLCNAGFADQVARKNITADKILYNYALQMCEAASVDELHGCPTDCFQRYEIAHILFHCLAQHIENEQDRILLTKYKTAVEKRLHLLKQKGLIYTTDLKLSI